ncbi:glycosyltransferase family 4 protein [Terriglobus albidus]|nr:glycosyltransferase family 4 protein [Terriglobus albidus]
MERFLKAISLEMTQSGWNCVFCFDGEISDVFREYISQPGVYLERVDSQGNLGFRAAFRLFSVLRKYRPSVFVYAFHGIMRCFPWIAYLNGCDSIYFNDHSSRAPGFVARPLSSPKRAIGRLLTWPLTGTLSVSHFTKISGHALGLSKAPGIVIPNGVEARETSAELSAAFRREKHIPSDCTLISLAAWMVPVKGIDAALRAAQIVLNRSSNTHFLFAGDGTHLRSFQYTVTELGIEHGVTFSGPIANPMEQGLFDATDIYMQPSLWQEAAPLAILEAMSLGLPVVASHIGGVPELVIDGKTGFLVPPGDSNALAECILRLTEDGDLRRSMGLQGKLMVQMRHQLHQTASQYAAVFLRKIPISGVPAVEQPYPA